VKNESSVALGPAAAAEQLRSAGPFAVIVRTPAEFAFWLAQPDPALQWLQVEGLLPHPEVWAMAAQGDASLPLDVVVANPAAEFSALYRLADVRLVREVRVTIPLVSGFAKALRLAASLQLPVRILPGQPDAEALAELAEAAEFYLHDPVVEAPIEFFHSLLGGAQDPPVTLWTILERDPGIFVEVDEEGRAHLPEDFVAQHLEGLIATGGECSSCASLAICGGFFKWPEPLYSCSGVKPLLARLQAAADELAQDLAGYGETAAEPPLLPHELPSL
jgi:hypothetical protein